MAKRKYTARGPKCPSCGARMHVPEGGGQAVCSFADSHASMRKQQLRRAAEQGDAAKNKSK